MDCKSFLAFHLHQLLFLYILFFSIRVGFLLHLEILNQRRELDFFLVSKLLILKDFSLLAYSLDLYSNHFIWLLQCFHFANFEFRFLGLTSIKKNIFAKLINWTYSYFLINFFFNIILINFFINPEFSVKC